MTPQERAQVLDAILAIPEPWDPVRRYRVTVDGDRANREAIRRELAWRYVVHIWADLDEDV